jgi:isopentenyl phosphate kinase
MGRSTTKVGSNVLQFLKLGGSLITDKSRPYTLRPEILKQVVGQIAAAWAEIHGLRLLLGHGAGSFAHISAKRHGTRQGIQGAAGWEGFARVWRDAASLNRVVMDALHLAGLPAVAFPPSACITSDDRQVVAWNLKPLRQALDAGILPVIYGDVIFDLSLGGTIFSTEDLFAYLARRLKPERILLAGIEPGVWADYPLCERIAADIHPENVSEIAPVLEGSAATDVTGGMVSKVRQMLDLAVELPDLEVRIFSGEETGNIREALGGAPLGTRISGKPRANAS